MTELRIALLSSCTIEMLERPFAAALRDRGLQPAIWMGGFGQYEQDVLNPASGLYGHEPSAVVLYLDGEDLFRELLQNPVASLAEARREYATQLVVRVRSMVDTL